MKRKANTLRIMLVAIGTACCLGLSSCAGWFGSIGVGPGGPVVDAGVDINSGPIGPGPGPGPGGPGPGGPGGPGGPF